MTAHQPLSPYRRLRRAAYHILGEEGHNEALVRLVDYTLMALITINCLFTILESVEPLADSHGHIFRAFDYFSVLIFSLEYLLRLWAVPERNQPRFRHPLLGRLRHIATPMALIDLVAVLPFYLAFFVPMDLRAMRVLRLLRIFKLTRYSQAMTIVIDVLRSEAKAVGAVLFVFAVIIVFISSLMYLLEHGAQPHTFSNIPAAMWWVVVTMTTVGYGDMVPITLLGRVVGALTAITGLGMIALLAGVLASGFSEQLRIRREQYQDQVEQALTESGQIPRRARRRLEEVRQHLGLTHEEAALILEHAAHAPTHCPHCGGRLRAPDAAASEKHHPQGAAPGV